MYRLNLHKYLAKHRFRQIDALFCQNLTNGKKLKILDVGCHNGRDFVSFLKGNDLVEITGIDLVDHGIEQKNFSYCSADAESVPYADNYFDLVVSVGVLEHISPIEKLCKVVSEIERVGKKHIIVVPSVTTLIEPHTASLLWQLRQIGSKRKYQDLNFFSDEAWLSFKGFETSKIKRFWLIPLLISNTYIYNV
jgi:ubiquinone/menaquinone biosynthesis C-methylase UbiE